MIEAARSGDLPARDALVHAHLEWVLSAAEERAGRGLSQSDLFQEGSLGLVKAISEFRSDRLEDFEDFVRHEVNAHMEQALHDETEAQEASRRLIEDAEGFERAEVYLRRELGRDPTPAELAAKLEWSTERTDRIAEMVAEARRKHDEELLDYLEDVDLDQLLAAGGETAAQEGPPSAIEPPGLPPGPRPNGSDGKR